jgi:hypothetical protein
VSTDDYRVTPHSIHPLSREQTRLCSSLTGAETVVPSPTADRLARCRAFKSLRAHASERFAEWVHDEWTRRGRLGVAVSSLRAAPMAISELMRSQIASSTNPWLIEATLTNLADDRFLVSKSELLKRLLGRPPSTSRQTISTIVIPTRQRNEALFRCIGSFAANQRIASRKARFIVSEDLPDVTLAGRYQPIGDGTDDIIWLTRADRQAFGARLSKEANISPDLVEFALLPTASGFDSLGANRNTLLLATIGERVLSVDDDTVCTPTPLGHERGLTLDSRFDPRQYRFFSDRAAALSIIAAEEVDVLALHEEQLGRYVSEIAALANVGSEIQLDHCDDRAIVDLWLGHGRIFVVTPGVVGRSGQKWPRRHVTIDESWANELLASDTFYEAAVTSQALAAAVPTPTLSNASFFSGMFFALDNTPLLPPFLPRGRASDVLFGRMLRHCHPDAYIGHLPWALAHDPPEARTCIPDELSGYVGIELAYLLTGALAGRPREAASPAERLRAMGETLRYVARMPASDFVAEMKRVYSRRAEQQLQEVESLLGAFPDAPVRWRRIATRYAQELHKALSRNPPPPPIDVATDSDEAWVLSQDRCRLFGELLHTWPDLVQATNALTERGDGLCRPTA